MTAGDRERDMQDDDESTRRVIARAPSGTPERRLASGRHPALDLPPDLQRQALRRLRIVYLLAAGLWVTTTLLYHYVDRVVGAGDLRWLSWRPSDLFVVAGAAVSIAFFLVTRGSRRSPSVLLDLALVYMVLTALIAGLIVHWEGGQLQVSMAPMISWTGVMVLLFAAALPLGPIRVLLAGLVSVSMNPIGMLVSRARGSWQFDSAAAAWIMHYPDFLVVGAAVVVAHAVTSLGRQVARARELGSYQLGELIGRGGMGEVYRATHRMLARPAAIKLIRYEIGHGPEAPARLAQARFRREAEAAASLQSAHTVALYDFGVTDDGTLYLVMELLDGLDLESLVRRAGPLPARRVVHLLRQVCASLEEAHAAGLVHRDIKPANIHVGRVGVEYDYVKVLDFGLVTALQGPDTQAVTMASEAGVVRGTPAYLAPEMALGHPVDARADLYALGCVAYFLLTGHLVFEGGTPIEAIVRRLQEVPPPPSSRTELPVPAALDALVVACLAREPSERPGTARGLSDALAAIDIAPWTRDEAADWWARHRPVAPDMAVPGTPS